MTPAERKKARANRLAQVVRVERLERLARLVGEHLKYVAHSDPAQPGLVGDMLRALDELGYRYQAHEMGTGRQIGRPSRTTAVRR